jgi:hypothetical protein
MFVLREFSGYGAFAPYKVRNARHRIEIVGHDLVVGDFHPELLFDE